MSNTKKILDQTAWGATATRGTVDISINKSEESLLVDLARQVAEIAGRPVEFEKRDLWQRLNALKPDRPLVFCDPENGWNEIITPQDLKSESLLAREWEMCLRKEIFWGTRMCDDRVIEPYFDLRPVYSESDWGVHETQIGGGDGRAYTWKAPIQDLDDLSALRFPTITIDADATSRKMELAQNVVGDHIEARIRGGWWWSLGLTWQLISLRGLEQMMIDMTDNPDGLHRIMAFLRDGTLAKLDYLESNSLLSMNTLGDYVGSGGFGWTDELPQIDFDGCVRTMDMWGFCESQETVGVSPGMFEEFVFQYQLPILERFGLNCYGCCEPLDRRWSVVSKTPRLRRVSVSSWNDQNAMAEHLQNNYIFSSKPAPSHLAMPTFDEDLVRKTIRKILDAANGCCIELIMKDNHTICNDPNRVIRWVEIAREEIEKRMVSSVHL